MTCRHGDGIVAGRADRDAVGCFLRAPVLLELVVAELVEALDDPRAGEAFLHDRAGAVRRGGQFGVVAVDGLPVVHRVDEDLAGEQVGWELAKAMRGDGQDDDVCVAHDLRGRCGARAGGEHVDGQRDFVGGARSRDRDVVAGRDGGAGERRAELARADDAEAQIRRLALGGSSRRSDRSAQAVIVSSSTPATRASSVSGARGEQLAHPRNHLAAEELDHGHALVVRDASDRVVQVEAAEAERADDRGDPAATVSGEPTYIEP